MPGTSLASPPPSQSSDDHFESVIRSPQQRKEALRNVYNNAQALSEYAIQRHVSTLIILNIPFID